jgi:membrane-associated phospholipid phosphatase
MLVGSRFKKPMDSMKIVGTKCAFLVATGLFTFVIFLGFAVKAGWGSGIDHAIGSAIGLRVGQSSPSAITFWKAISWTGGGFQRYYIVASLGLLLGVWRNWRFGAGFIVASLLAVMGSTSLKIYFDRVRPELVPHLDTATDMAFPSGHATSAAVVYILFALLAPPAYRRYWMGAGIGMMLLTGISRITLGVHWSSDIVGGWMLGAACAFLMAGILQYIEQSR